MREIQFIVDYLKDIYGLEEKTHTSIPKDDFELFKVDFYIFVKNKISKKLFYFLKNKFPIKCVPYKESACLYKKENGITVVEILIDQTIRLYIFNCYLKSGFFEFSIDKTIDNNDIFKKINITFTNDYYFKSLLRDYRIKSL